MTGAAGRIAARHRSSQSLPRTHCGPVEPALAPPSRPATAAPSGGRSWHPGAASPPPPRPHYPSPATGFRSSGTRSAAGGSPSLRAPCRPRAVPARPAPDPDRGTLRPSGSVRGGAAGSRFPRRHVPGSIGPPAPSASNRSHFLGSRRATPMWRTSRGLFSPAVRRQPISCAAASAADPTRPPRKLRSSPFHESRVTLQAFA